MHLLVPQLVSDRNTAKHALSTIPAETARALTDGGRAIWLRTHREPATCNVLARIAGLGQE